MRRAARPGRRPLGVRGRSGRAIRRRLSARILAWTVGMTLALGDAWAPSSRTEGHASEWQAGGERPDGNAFGMFAPWIVLSNGDWRRLDANEPVVRTLHGEQGQVAVFVATRLDARPDALAAWTRAIAELKQSRFVLAIGRFSDPPAVSDLGALSLDERDLDAIRRCTPDDCGLKLAASDIQALRRVIAGAGGDWRSAVQIAFRRLMVARVNAYRKGGLSGLPRPAENGTSHPPDATFETILGASPYLRQIPHLERWLREYPAVDAGRVESFFYWSKELYGGGKPVVSITHVGIVRQEASRRLPAVLVAGKQMFATHYLEGGLGLTMVLQDPAGERTYLAYLNRSQIDFLRGFFGKLAREIVEGRLERHAPSIIRGLRQRLEGGSPGTDPLG